MARSTLLVFGLRARSSIAGEPAIAPRDAHRGYMNSVHHEIARGTFMVMPPIPPGIGTLHPKVVQSVRTDVPAELERALVDGGVREGKPENPLVPGIAGAIGLLILVIVGLALIGLVVRFLWTGQLP